MNMRAPLERSGGPGQRRNEGLYEDLRDKIPDVAHSLANMPGRSDGSEGFGHLHHEEYEGKAQGILQQVYLLLG